MSKSGSGFGSALIALVFAVLCLTILTLITFASAKNEKAMMDAEAELVAGYYEADALAERILAEILSADKVPDLVCGISVTAYRDSETDAEIGEFSCPISDHMELYVRIAQYGTQYDTLAWQMRSTSEWSADEVLPIWSGD